MDKAGSKRRRLQSNSVVEGPASEAIPSAAASDEPQHNATEAPLRADGDNGDEDDDAGSESEEDSDEGSASSVHETRKVLPERATRGTRMGRLVGEAAEADEAFWGQSAFTAGSSGDEGFSSSDAEALSGTTCSSDSDIDFAEPDEETDFPRGVGKGGGGAKSGGRSGPALSERDDEGTTRGGGRYVDKGAAGLGGVDFKAAVSKALAKVAASGGQTAAGAGDSLDTPQPAPAGIRPTPGPLAVTRELRGTTVDSVKDAADVRVAWRVATCRCVVVLVQLPLQARRRTADVVAATKPKDASASGAPRSAAPPEPRPTQAQVSWSLWHSSVAWGVSISAASNSRPWSGASGGCSYDVS